MTTRSILLVAAVAAVLAVIGLSFLVAPETAYFTAPLTQRIFYYHVPSAWVAYLAFGVTAASSALYLWRKEERADRVAHASAEVGLVFSTIALVTGIVWSRVEFANYTAAQDPKVITLIVLMLAYAAYLLVRAGVLEPERRARLAAVFGILAVLGVPLSYYASTRSVHPDFTRSGSELEPKLGMILGLCVVAFTVLYAYFVTKRANLIGLRERLEALGGE